MASPPGKKRGKDGDDGPGEFLGLPKPLGSKGGQGVITKAKVTQEHVDEVLKGNKAAGEPGGQGSPDGSRPFTTGTEDPTEATSDDDEPSRDQSRLQTATSLPKAESIAEEGPGDDEPKGETKQQKRERLRTAHVRKQFDKVDVKGKGLVETHRLHEAFGILGLKFEKFEVNKMITKFDGDNSGTIDFNEFKDMIGELNRKRYHKVFADFDVDGSGELDVDEVKAAFALLDFQFSDEQMASMMAEFDDSGDGLIQFAEFAEMLDSTLIGEEEKQEINIVDETPWADSCGVQTPIEPVWLEAEGSWGWAVVSEREMDVDENPDDRVIGVGIPPQRATCYVRTDGLPFRGLKGGVYMPIGWRSKNKPVRSIHWGMPETSSWEGPGGALVGTGEVERVRVRFTAPTLHGAPDRVLLVPDASLAIQPMGDTPTELDPDEGKDVRPWRGWDTPVLEPWSGGGGEGGGGGGEGAEAGRRTGRGLSKLVSFNEEDLEGFGGLSAGEGGLGEGARHEGEGEVLTIMSRPGSLVQGPLESPAMPEGGFSPLQSLAATPELEGVPGGRDGEGVGGAATAGSEDAGGAPITAGGARRGSAKPGAAPAGRKGSKPPTGDRKRSSIASATGAGGRKASAVGSSVGGGGSRPGSATTTGSGKDKAAGNKDDKKDYKLEKMRARLEDLRMKQAQDGLALMEGREMALLQRHIRKAEEEAAAKKEEEERLRFEELSWQPVGLVQWRFKIIELSDTGLGMRVGVVHASVEPGKDWNDYTSCNNKTFWWNSFSGNIFVGDVKVAESGSIYSLDICKGMWAPSRNDPTMGVPFMQGDVVTIRLDLEAGELAFKRNDDLLPHRVCGVWGEVFPAVQMSAAGDKVMLLETPEEKDMRVNGRLMEERRKAEEERKKRDIARKAALQALGLV